MLLGHLLTESMYAPFKPPQHLAPLQLTMLETTGQGHHVEQAEIVFSQGVMPQKIIAAWVGTVAGTEALRLQFLQDAGGWRGVPLASGVICEVDAEIPVPASWGAWLATDHARPLLTPESLPWRAVYWPAERRFIWTFHHALLDGRSITRILKGFFERIQGGDPGTLRLARWQPADAGSDFLNEFEMISKQACGRSSDQDSPGPAVCHLGEVFLEQLKSLVKTMGITVATLITWSWGLALVRGNGKSKVVLEQLRAGAPQPGTAGFTMNLLPVVITKACCGDGSENLRAFAKQIRELRKLENVSLDAIYQGRSFENSVIMVERQTMAHELAGPMIESFKLHEAKGEALAAMAHILPDLRLEVEGPQRHRLLNAWIDVLREQITCD
jgi:hypothetical protein